MATSSPQPPNDKEKTPAVAAEGRGRPAGEGKSDAYAAGPPRVAPLINFSDAEIAFLLAFQEETYELHFGPANQAIRAHGFTSLEIGPLETAAQIWYLDDPQQKSADWPWQSAQVLKDRIQEAKEAIAKNWH